jgi:hypothetical protein
MVTTRFRARSPRESIPGRPKDIVRGRFSYNEKTVTIFILRALYLKEP